MFFCNFELFLSVEKRIKITEDGENVLVYFKISNCKVMAVYKPSFINFSNNPSEEKNEYANPYDITTKTLNLDGIAQFWPKQEFFGHRMTFSLDLFAVEDFSIPAFQSRSAKTGVRIPPHGNKGLDFFVNFKGWRFTDRIVSKDKIFHLYDIGAVSNYAYENDDEMAVTICNFSAEPFIVARGMPLGRLLIYHKEDQQ